MKKLIITVAAILSISQPIVTYSNPATEPIVSISDIQQMALDGNTEAQIVLGSLHIAAMGVANASHSEALKWLIPAAMNGSVDAQAMVGALYDKGDGIPPDYQESRKWLNKAASKNNRYAKSILGSQYATGSGVEVDIVKAKYWFKSAVSENWGDRVTKVKSKNATSNLPFVKWCPFIAKEGNVMAMIRLAKNSLVEDKVADYKSASGWFRMSASRGIALAYLKNSPLYFAYLGSLEPDFKDNAEYCEIAAKAGNSDAQAILGTLHSEGLGVSKDTQKAIDFFRLAAEQGDSYSQVVLAGYYMEGRGVVQDFKEAAKRYKLAADQGNRNAQRSLAVLHYEGKGVYKNNKTAFKLFLSAAEGGDTESQLALAGMYLNGEGVAKNPKAAAKWIQTAADNGNEEAKSIIKSFQK